MHPDLHNIDDKLRSAVVVDVHVHRRFTYIIIVDHIELLIRCWNFYASFERWSNVENTLMSMGARIDEASI